MVRFAVLAQRDARLLLATRLTTQGSDGIQQAALGTYVLFSPESRSTAVAVAIGFSILLLPYSVIGPFAGVMLDLWSRRMVLLGANALRAVATLGIAWQLGPGDSDGLLAALVLLHLGLGRFVLAGLSAGVPHVVAPDQLVTANAGFPTAGTLSAATTTLITAALLGLIPGATAAHAEAAAGIGYLSAALLAALIPKTRLGPSPSETGDESVPHIRSVARDLARGVAHLASREAAWRPMLVTVLHRVAFGCLTLSGLFIARWQSTYGQAIGEAVLLAGGAGGGAFLAALSAPRGVRRWGSRETSFAALAIGLLAPACYAAADGTDQVLWLLLGGAAIGFAGQWVKIAADTALQRNLSDLHRGRAFTLFDISLNAGLVTGIWIAALTIPASGYSAAAMLAVVSSLGLAMWLVARTANSAQRPNSTEGG